MQAERLQAEADEKEKGEFHHARYLQELDKREQQARKRHDEILTAYKVIYDLNRNKLMTLTGVGKES